MLSLYIVDSTNTLIQGFGRLYSARRALTDAPTWSLGTKLSYSYLFFLPTPVLMYFDIFPPT